MPPDTAKWFCSWLDESAEDFRVGSAALSGLRFVVYGCGNSLYGKNFNMVSAIPGGLPHAFVALSSRSLPCRELRVLVVFAD